MFLAAEVLLPVRRAGGRPAELLVLRPKVHPAGHGDGLGAWPVAAGRARMCALWPAGGPGRILGVWATQQWGRVLGRAWAVGRLLGSYSASASCWWDDLDLAALNSVSPSVKWACWLSLPQEDVVRIK